MRRGFFAALLVAGALVGAMLAGCAEGGKNAIGPDEGAYRGSEPPGHITLPPFALHDVVTGEPVGSANFRGRVLLVTFVDSECKDKCPLLASAIAEALRLLPQDARRKTSALAISVDPLIDTRANVTRFLRQRHAQALTYLSGSVAELKPVWKRFGVVSAYETGNADTHSADVRVFNARGIWVSTQHSGVDLSPANLAHDVEQALMG